MERAANGPSNSHVPGATKEFTGLGALRPSEKRWRDRYFYLKQCGYTLRPRYHPDWTPSWLGTGLPADIFEDCIMSSEGQVLDAVRTVDNYRVSIKVVSRTSEETKIAQLLTSKEMLSHPHNHCVPILDVLPDPLSPSHALLVMIYLRSFYDPDFELVEEVVDFVRQTLEGLSFIHSQRVAHRDCGTLNIMMDGRLLYPDDHHPQRTQLTPDGSRLARHFSRTERPVRYYYIDWGLSSHFEEGESPYVLGAKCADRDAPELSNEYPYNAYMLDVFLLGHMYDMDLVQVYHGLDFLEPLILAMTHQQPERRPTADSALRMFFDIRRNMSRSQLPWRLRKRNESGTERVLYDTISAAKVGLNMVRKGLMG